MGYKHKYVVGETYAFYNNSEDLETNVNFNYWTFDLVHSDSFIPVFDDVAVLAKDIISGTDYRWYADEFVFPTVDNGCYRFIIQDTVQNQVLYVSNIIEVVSNDDGLTLVQWRNEKNILNYNYEGLPSFQNIAHFEVFKRKPLRPELTDGYPLANGSFLRVNTVLTKTFEFVTGWFDELEHDAFQEMLIHSSKLFAFDGNFNEMAKPSESEYLLEWADNYEFQQATVRLEQVSRSSSNKGL